MTALNDVVRTLAGRDGVDLVVLLSGDGLPIEVAGVRAGDPEAIAALSATLLRDADRLSREVTRGELRTVVLDGESGATIVAQVGAGNAIVITTRTDANFGPLLVDLRRHRPALAALL
jgi:predicted regulator of Ras-like GTPase activity (Roadblock/LC7/MglB family)